MKSLIEATANLLTAIACALVIVLAFHQLKARWAASPPPHTKLVEHIPNVRLTLPKSTTKGNPIARVALIEFSDFQCPFCGAYTRDTYPVIENEFVSVGKVKYAFRNYPMAPLRPFALKAAVASLCASDEDKF